ncbi:MAG: recombinase family protein [Candidatus Caccovivens sp.]
MKEKVVVYARYSSEKQTEQSIEGQLHVCKDFADKNNLQIIETYIDRAKTGRNDNREGFQQMLKDSASHKFTAVLVYALDRFSRNRYDSAVHKATLKKNGVKLISATQPISENPEGILLESLLEGLAEYYSAELSQKLARGRRESIAKGQFIGGFVPYGYKIIDKKYFIDENEAENVKLIYRLFNKMHNYKDVLSYLENNCIYNRNKTKFKQHQVSNILNNKIYTGYLQRGQYICENATPVIIDKKFFEETQLIMKNSYIERSKSPAKFLLAGKVVCGECGANLIGDSATGKLGKVYYYYCCQKKKINQGCDLDRIPKDKFEKYIYRCAQDELSSPQFLDRIVTGVQEIIDKNDDSERIKSLKNDLISIDKKLDNIVTAIQNGIINDKIKEQNEELLKQKDAIYYQIQEIENNPLYDLSPKNIRDYIFNKYSKAGMETILKTLIYKVYVYKDHIVVIFNIRDNNDPTKRKKVELGFDNRSHRSTTTIPYNIGDFLMSSTLKTKQKCLKIFTKLSKIFIILIKSYQFSPTQFLLKNTQKSVLSKKVSKNF